MKAQRQAPGSDIWPLTWGADGDLYTAWGDGGGFGGSDVRGRVSIGFARIAGTPERNGSGFEGHNLWGAAPSFAEHQTNFGGKIQSILSVRSGLYAYGGIWTHANCKCPDPTKLEGDGPKNGRTLAWSNDLGRTWKLARWKSAANVYFLNYGQDNWEARDSYVYEYYLRAGDTSHIYLRRVHPSKLTTAPNSKSREYLAAVNATGEHVRWSTHEARAIAVFTDPANVSLPAVTYNAPLGRYLLTVGHNPGGTHASLSAGQLGLFEAANPWGPWAAIDYQDDWGSFGTSATGAYLGLHIPAKWISANGESFWAAFSNLHEFDSFNVIKGTLTVSDAVPRLLAPTAGTSLSAGESYIARAAGTKLTWTAEARGGRIAELGRGAGNEFEFRVPSTTRTGEVVRLTVKSSDVAVYRDFLITNSRRR
jgi:hypothetical protein